MKVEHYISNVIPKYLTPYFGISLYTGGIYGTMDYLIKKSVNVTITIVAINQKQLISRPHEVKILLHKIPTSRTLLSTVCRITGCVKDTRNIPVRTCRIVEDNIKNTVTTIDGFIDATGFLLITTLKKSTFDILDINKFIGTVHLSVTKCKHLPVSANQIVRITVFENITVGSLLVDISSGAYKYDEYHLINGSDLPFIIDSYNGKVYLTGTLDYEYIQSYNLIVNMTSSANRIRQNQCIIYITILDTNDNLPVISVSQNTILASKVSNANTKLFQAVAVDIDSGPNGQTEFLPFLTSNPIELADSFSISSNGTVVVSRLSNSSIGGYLTIAASDRGTPPNYAYHTVEIIDDNPTDILSIGWPTSLLQTECCDPFNWNVNENADSIFVGTLPIPVNMTFNLTIINVNPEFVFDSFKLQGIELHTTRNFNYEKLSAVNVVILNHERQCHFLVHINIANVNDCPPKFIRNYNLEILEEEGPNYFVTTLTAVDEDTKSSNLVYGLVTNGIPFRVSVDGKLFTTRNFDYEVEKLFSFEVSVTDGKFVIKTTIYVTIIDINDNNPQFTSDLYQFYAWSNNSFIGQVKANDIDMDGNQEISFFLLTPSSIVSLDPKTGIFSNNYYWDNSSTTMTVDVAIVAVDHGNLPTSSMARASIRLEAFENFDQIDHKFNYSIPVTMNARAKLFNITDKLDLDLNSEKCRFNINNNMSSNDYRLFELENENILWFVGYDGLIKLFGKTVLLYIDIINIAFPLNKGKIVIYIEIGASNYNTPIFHQTKYEFIIDESYNGDSSPIGKVSAVDSDAGSYGEIQYSMLYPAIYQPFEINSHSGELRYLMKMADINIVHYTIVVIASDIGYESKQTRVNVDVIIKDRSTNVTFNMSVYECYIPSEQPSTCQPTVRSRNPETRFVTNDTTIFRVDPFSGQIMLTKKDVIAGTYITTICLAENVTKCATVIIIVTHSTNTDLLSGILDTTNGNSLKIKSPFGIVLSKQSKYAYRLDNSLMLKSTGKNHSNVEIFIYDISKNPTVVKMSLMAPSCNPQCKSKRTSLRLKEKKDAVARIKCTKENTIISTNQCSGIHKKTVKMFMPPVSFFSGAFAKVILPRDRSVSSIRVKYKVFDNTMRVLALLNKADSPYSNLLFTKGCTIGIQSRLQRKELNICNTYPKNDPNIEILINLRPLSISFRGSSDMKLGLNIYLKTLWFGGYLYGPILYEKKLYQPFRGVLLSLKLDETEANMQIFEQSRYLRSAFYGDILDPCTVCSGSCNRHNFGSQCKSSCMPECSQFSRWNLFSATFALCAFVFSLCVFFGYLVWRNRIANKYKRTTSSLCLTENDRTDKIYTEQPLPLPMTPFSNEQELHEQVRNAFYDPQCTNTDQEYGITVGIYLEPNVSQVKCKSNRADDCLETNYLSQRACKDDLTNSMENIIRTLPKEEIGIDNSINFAINCWSHPSGSQLTSVMQP